MMDVQFLILSPYRGHWQMEIFPDSRIVRANCGHLCWLSPQGESRLQVAYTNCLDCAQEIVDSPDQQKFMVAGTFSAIRRLWGDDAVIAAGLEAKRLGLREEPRDT